MAITNLNKIGFKLLLSIFISPSIFILLPILLSPFFIYRILIKILAIIFKPQLGEMLSFYSAILATYNPCDKGKVTVSSSFIVKRDNVNVQKIEKIADMVLQNKYFHKAKQNLVKFMGFYFWMDDPNFELKNHLFFYDKLTSATEYEEFLEEITEIPFQKGRPLWEIHVFKNYVPNDLTENNNGTNIEHSTLVLRLHHCLNDFLSILPVFDEIKKCKNKIEKADEQPNKLQISCSNKLNSKKPKIPTLTIRQQIFVLVKLLVIGPVEFFMDLFNTSIAKQCNLNLTYKYLSSQGKIPLLEVKKIARKRGVGTATLVIAAYAGAIRQTLLNLPNSKIPNKIRINTPLPWPGRRPRQLDMCFVTTTYSLPVGELDPKFRLQKTQKEFESLMTSHKIPMMYILFKLIGYLPSWIMKKLANAPVKGAAITLAQGPTDFKKMIDIDLADLSIRGAMPFGDVVILGGYSVNINDILYIRVKGDTSLFQQSDSADKFIKYFFEELDILNY